jgi:tetraacyldisaccharide 4'-kinase
MIHRALFFLPLFYRAAVSLRLSLYRQGLIKSTTLPGRVVSIGNVTVGGTGKTPAVIMIAERAMAWGRRVCILTRGYGGRKKGRMPLVVSDTTGVLARPEEAGDEAFLMAKRLPGVPILASPYRVKAGLEAFRRWGCDLFILDDGFQHMSLKRDADIVLLDHESPFGNGLLLPLGPLREPKSSLMRADAIIITRAGDGIPESLRYLALDKRPVFTAEHVVRRIVIPAGGKSLPIECVRGRKVLGFAGIGKPSSFNLTLDAIGAEVLAFEAFPDHHPYGPSDIRRLVSLGLERGVELALTTEKDWVRLGTWNPPFEAGYVEIDFKVREENDFFSFLKRMTGSGPEGY